MSDRPFKKIAIMENAIEAQLIGSILEDQDIPYRIRTFHDTAYDGLFQVQKGWGELYTTETAASQVLEILESVRAGQSIVSND